MHSVESPPLLAHDHVMLARIIASDIEADVMASSFMAQKLRRKP